MHACTKSSSMVLLGAGLVAPAVHCFRTPCLHTAYHQLRLVARAELGSAPFLRYPSLAAEMQARAESKAKAGAQLAQVRTVHNFVDSDGTCHAINSPRSLKAIWLEGFTPAELKPVTREAIAARYKERVELVDIRTEHAQKKRAAKLHVACQRRDRIIKEEEHEAAKKAAGLAAMTMEFGEGQDPAAMDKGQQTIAKLAQEAQALQSRMMELEAKAVASMKVRQKKELDRMVQGQREMVELQRKISEGER